MNSELVQTGFFDLEEVRNAEPIQVIYDYSRVTPEQAEKLQEIYKRIFVRHVATTYEDGRDLLEAQSIEGLPFDEFIESAKASFGWSKATIINKMNAALRWGDFSPAAGLIEDQAIYLLSSKRVPETVRQEAKALLAAGENIDEERAKQLRDAERARKEAERKAEEKERELILFKQEVEANEQAHVALVQSLEQKLEEKLEEKPEPVKVIEYQDTLETTAKISELETLIELFESKPDITPEKQKELDKLQLDLKNAQTELGFYEKQNKALAEHVTQLSEESRRSFSENIIAVGQLRIRQNWQFATGEVQAALRKFITRVPSDIDRESFEGEEHTRTAQTIEVLEQTAALLKKTLLGSDTTGMIDADTPTTITHTQPALPCPTSPTNPTSLPSPHIPSNHDELFAQYKRFVQDWPEPKLWWRAPEIGIMDMEMDVHYMREPEPVSNGQ